MAKVIVATEGTEDGVAAIRTALDLLGPGHEYVFLIVGRPPFPVPGTAMAGEGAGIPVVPDAGSIEEMTSETADAAERALDDVMTALKGAPPARKRVELGDPASTIIEVASDEAAELIVVGATHSGVIHRLLSGSVADQVARHAPCPVLITRPGHPGD